MSRRLLSVIVCRDYGAPDAVFGDLNTDVNQIVALHLHLLTSPNDVCAMSCLRPFIYSFAENKRVEALIRGRRDSSTLSGHKLYDGLLSFERSPSKDVWMLVSGAVLSTAILTGNELGRFSRAANFSFRRSFRTFQT